MRTTWGQNPEVVVSNRFQPLQELDLAPVPEIERIDEPQGTPLARLVAVGDAIIGGVDSTVCACEKDSCTVCCLSGAQVGDILEHVDKLLARAGRDPVVMVHIGTNDIGKGRFEVLQDTFVELAEIPEFYLHHVQAEAELYLEV